LFKHVSGSQVYSSIFSALPTKVTTAHCCDAWMVENDAMKEICDRRWLCFSAGPWRFATVTKGKQGKQPVGPRSVKAKT